LSTFWEDYEVYFPIQETGCNLDVPIIRYDQFSEDRSEGQQSSKDRMLVQLLVQVCINMSRSMVQVIIHDWKSYQVHFPTQQMAHHLDFRADNNDQFTEGCTEA
jgi:hypothetical protein